MSFATLEEKEQLLTAFFEAEDSVEDAPVVDLLKEMKDFMSKYGKGLGELREALSDTVSEAWAVENNIIDLDMVPTDQTHLLEMVQTDNQQFNKVAIAFAVLCQEMQLLVQHAESKYYGPLTMFGHDIADPTIAKDEDSDDDEDAKQPSLTAGQMPESQMGAFLPFLQDLSNFVGRVRAVLKNTVHQLACLYHERQKLYISTFKHVKLTFVFQNISSLAAVLFTLDQIITDNEEIAEKWGSYKRMIKYVRANPEQYGVSEEELLPFQQLLMDVNNNILSGNIFESFIASDFGMPATDAEGNVVPGNAQVNNSLVAGNRALSEQFTSMTNFFFERIEQGIGQPVETYPRERVVHLFCLYAFYRRIFVSTLKPNTKMYAKLWTLQKKVPLVPLYGQSVFFIAEFMTKYAPLRVKSLNPDVKKVLQTRMDYLKSADANFIKNSETLYLHMCMWMVRIESELVSSKTHTLSSILNARSKLLLNGLLLANQIKNQLVMALFLHQQLRAPFQKKNIRQIAVCMEMLKAIEFIYSSRLAMIGENVTHLISQTCYTLARIFVPLKKKLEEFAQLDETKLDAYAAVRASLDCLSKNPSKDRLTVFQVVVSVAQLKNLFRKNHLDEIEYQIWKLNLLTSFQVTLKKITNCSFIFWHQNLVKMFFQDVFKHPSHVYRLPYLFAALQDANRLLVHVPSGPESEGDAKTHRTRLLANYQKEIFMDLESCIVKPLCREVETDLRLHIHSVVLEQANLRASKVRDLSYFLSCKPMKFFKVFIDLKERVTHELDVTFYNLTTVALHDWRVYAEMRNLANEKYGLEMQEVFLPGTSHYSDALDILQIMRKIHMFVARYVYNMNTQIFMERAFDQRHLNSINVAHISQSIRTHGLGIMNTAVNFTYQFLCRKFMIFSEFLYDDNIKSRLIKDIRWYGHEKEALDLHYPFERAEKFAKQIRVLGVTKTGLTYLDQFRNQVTEIGNALGYVRMVRSGGLKYLSNASQFVPDLLKIPSFESSLNVQQSAEGKENGLPPSPATIKAAQHLDAVLDNLRDSLAEGTEYFQILVNVFKNVFDNDEQAHLRTFYMIVPPLTLNFVEQLIARKDMVHKKGGRTEASFTDDGFALGLAYILKLLNQDAVFDSLHWFESVNKYVNQKKAEMKRIRQKKSKKAQSNDEDLQHLQLTAKRLEAVQREFELLYYSFSGARIFFRAHGHNEAAAAVEAKQEADDEEEAQPGDEGDEGDEQPGDVSNDASPPGAASAAPTPPSGGAPPPPGPPPPPPPQ